MADVAAENAATVLTVICPLHIGDGWCPVVFHHEMESSSTPMGRAPYMIITAAGAYAFTTALTYAAHPCVIEARGFGNTEDESIEDNAKQMVANLLAADPEAFEFDSEHWSLPPTVVVQRVSAALRHAALARTLCAMYGIKRWCLQSSADPTIGAQE